MAFCQDTSGHEGKQICPKLTLRLFFKFRFNFHENRGEVKIEREWRQKCSFVEKHSGENGAFEYVYPDLVEDKGARWVMGRLR